MSQLSAVRSCRRQTTQAGAGAGEAIARRVLRPGARAALTKPLTQTDWL